ncbi:hypothetical protein CBR_g72659 [Chara braunii]|uniref:Uncharacterized protein n=1 Tax=Chara braunii TaxID=69332 RepID=A0A388K9Z8_CHABU|nr:hypothetical protein CBR_g72659 [Chara braunii]|eukprot:GBG66904.1 hypothetical protein CBR_g72659 [Chara braunii]
MANGGGTLQLPDDALKTLEDCGALRALPAMQVQSYKGRQTIKMHQPSPLVSLEMSSELTGTIQMHPVSGSTGIAAARMSAVMSVANGKLQLLQRPDASMWPGASGARGGRIAELSDLHANNWRLFQTEKQKRWICGSIDANKLIVSLGQKGFTDVQVVVNRRPRGGRERKRQGEADLDSSLDNESKKRKILPEAAGQDLRPDRKEGEVEERVMMEGCFRRDRSHQQNSGERVQVSSAIGDKGNLLMTNEICGTFTTAVAGGEDTIEVDLMERDREVREFTDLSPVVGRSNEKDGEGEPQHYTRIGNEKSVAQEGDGKSASEKEEGEIEEMTDDAANDIEEDATNRIVQGIEVVGEEDTVLIAVKSATTKTTIKISKNETHIHASHPLHRQMLLEAVIAELCVL